MTLWRLQVIGLSCICFAAAIGDGWLAGGAMGHLVRGFAERRAVITSSQFSLSSLLLVPMGIVIGLLLLFSKRATPEEMRKASARPMPFIQACLAFIFGSLVAAALATPVQHVVVGVIALHRGYVACPRPLWPRRQPDRWALPGPHSRTERCPGEGADPNV